MAEVMAERQGLGEILVEPQRARKRARDLRDFERMGEPGAVVVALMKDEHLRFMGKPPKRGRVDDAITVAAKRVARRAHPLGMKPPAASARSRRVSGACDRRFNRHGAPPD